jgi:hypothetical protein
MSPMQHQGITLTDAEAASVRELCERIGERAAREKLGISHQTLARAIGQMHIQRGTLALIRGVLESEIP